jgi:hypothetical protein
LIAVSEVRARNQGLPDFHCIIKPNIVTYQKCLHFKRKAYRKQYREKEKRKEFFNGKTSDKINEPEMDVFYLSLSD